MMAQSDTAKFRLVFTCCKCKHRYNLADGIVTNLKDWKNGYSKEILEIGKLKDLNHFPLECPKCGLRHVLVIFPLPWEESVKKETRK